MPTHLCSQSSQACLARSHSAFRDKHCPRLDPLVSCFALNIRPKVLSLLQQELDNTDLQSDVEAIHLERLDHDPQAG